MLYISHHLEEVFEICQDVAVIRDGQLVLTAPAEQVTKEQIVSAMVGTEAGSAARSEAGTAVRQSKGAPRLIVDRLTAISPNGSISNVSLEVAAGERVGVTGLLSAGVATLARAVAGAEPYEFGQVLLDGRPLPRGRRDRALRAGVGYIPQDRQAEGFVSVLGVAENSTMTIVDWLSRKLGWLSPATRANAAEPLTRRLSVVSAGPRQPVGEFPAATSRRSPLPGR